MEPQDLDIRDPAMLQRSRSSTRARLLFFLCSCSNFAESDSTVFSLRPSTAATRISTLSTSAASVESRRDASNYEVNFIMQDVTN